MKVERALYNIIRYTIVGLFFLTVGCLENYPLVSFVLVALNGALTVWFIHTELFNEFDF